MRLSQTIQPLNFAPYLADARLGKRGDCISHLLFTQQRSCLRQLTKKKPN